MNNNISTPFDKHPHRDDVVSMRNITFRERLLRLLLGKPYRLMVITPVNNSQQLQINEVKEEPHE